MPSLGALVMQGPWMSGQPRVSALRATLGAALVALAGTRAPEKSGLHSCPCLDHVPQLENFTRNTASNQHVRTRMAGELVEPIDDCLLVEDFRPPGREYCYPVDYGRGRCDLWDVHLVPDCARWAGEGEYSISTVPEHCKGSRLSQDKEQCMKYFRMPLAQLPWCGQPWCYVDPGNCDLIIAPSFYFGGQDVWYSYDTCDSGNYFEVWNVVQITMCESFSVVEKPYIIMWLSCWACAFIQQLIDMSRELFEEQQDRLGKYQRIYVGIQLAVLVTETFANIQRIPWRQNDFWSNYNLYVYVFINSSVFIRATMMSQIVWDWYKAKLLKFPVLPYQYDGKGWTDEHRGRMLVIIFQFLSSLGVFGVIVCTHVLPGGFVYHWIFLIVAAGLVKSRSWVAMLGMDPDGRFGRALVMGTNSFMSCTGTQLLVTCMVRVYAGEWRSGYLGPLKNDFLSRRLSVWYSCHLEKGFSWQMFLDQDFINLFVR